MLVLASGTEPYIPNQHSVNTVYKDVALLLALCERV